MNFLRKWGWVFVLIGIIICCIAAATVGIFRPTGTIISKILGSILLVMVGMLSVVTVMLIEETINND